ncbi:Tungsten-containing aldehyde ferredoxin oxidoreductase [uncultured Desulfobacterium sp.]|uniref:Tungsten-containing aldehyde ferredoxin oxidoreductase n=1 Tax=uncultured Desulfobacterium sp. TaxID=201089 RepID=A0A445N109_9BACT|nr:Tungsten-containing aldehyde ferredoxin oxidoreductase [uncultured Desulfobacterium sp.]
MKGWTGKILRIDLSNRTHKTDDLDANTAKMFIGGHGVATKILMDEMDPKVDPLSAENKLIFSIGPLTGTVAPLGSRYMITTKSPLTGLLGFGNSGGFFGPAMRNAGYDHIVFEGKSDKPVYVLISDEDIQFKDAGHLWGKDTYETEDIIRKETEDSGKRVRVSCIGPAGEKQALIAAVMNDKHRAAARCGIGAVMGSKNLKAVAVTGKRKEDVADSETLSSLSKTFRQKFKENPGVENFTEFGTSGVVNLLNEMGVLPTRNFQKSSFEEAANLSGETLKDKYLQKNKACFGCPVACGRGTKISEGKYEGEGEGPEYETVALLGSNLGNGNLAAVTKANYLCNQLGIDTISAGGTIACAMEMYEKGYLSKEDTGGIALEFGDGDLVVKLVEMIGSRTDFGDVLADGGFKLAERYGHPECFMGVHKMEIPGYEPRGAKGMGITYVTSTIGPSHCRGYTIPFEIMHTAGNLDPIEETGKGMISKSAQDMTCAWDATGLCLFATLALGIEDVISLMMAATGVGFGFFQFLGIGERIFNLQRMFNLKAGLRIEDEKLPERFYKEPLPDGPNAGAVLDLKTEMSVYYNLRGWNMNHIPSKGKLKALGLGNYVA